MDLQLFNDELDFEALQQEFEESYQEQEEEIEQEQEQEEEIEQEQEQEEDVTPPALSEDANRAFADLRRQAQENARFRDFVQKIADSSGVTPDQVIQAYEEKFLEQQAQEQKIPVEVAKRITKLEQDNNLAHQNLQRERFIAQVTSVKDKYNLTDAQVTETIQKAVKEGINVVDMAFENVYKLVNMDTIVQQQVEQARQKELESKKKRENESALPNNDGGASSSDLDDVASEVEAFLREQGDIT